ncbi:hypothetical protein HHK36_008722 [Tetracentron sinense]|uniref:Uncharacterized protein n=1 Tax=Tetracentron sinense TaxID=13715 RepID=A0A834ZH92_TETSI|nr:hypothetical protein HHK36_008722 [Tetracentron sinense]
MYCPFCNPVKELSELGASYEEQQQSSSSGCNVTSCTYDGSVNGTILTRFSMSPVSMPRTYIKEETIERMRFPRMVCALRCTFDPELRSVLELATDSELYELERIVFSLERTTKLQYLHPDSAPCGRVLNTEATTTSGLK